MSIIINYAIMAICGWTFLTAVKGLCRKNFNSTIVYGVGTIKKNPTKTNKLELQKVENCIWVLYEEKWYSTIFMDKEHFLTYLKKHPTYSKEELFDLMVEITII